MDSAGIGSMMSHKSENSSDLCVLQTRKREIQMHIIYSSVHVLRIYVFVYLGFFSTTSYFRPVFHQCEVVRENLIIIISKVYQVFHMGSHF